MADLPVMQRALGAYLGALSGGFAIGQRDCCTFLADWLIARGLPDVMADRRGAYASIRAFQRMLKREGGLLAACDCRFAAAGLVAAFAARPGDVAVLRAPYAVRGGRLLMRRTGAIALTQTHFAMLGTRSVLIASSLPVDKVWTVPHHA